MKKIACIFTLDYETFGDGSGDALREQIIPTAHLANVLELYGLRLTIFVEVGQMIYFRKHGMNSWFEPIEEQLIDLAKRGHDIQLHIHPMWFYAPAPVNGQIRLNTDKYDLSMLDPEEIESIVSHGCQYLTSLINPFVPGYKPVAYRAGAWSMERRKVLFEILLRKGIEIDSTIAPGAKFSAVYGRFDYTGFKMRPFWSEEGLVELPILTERTPLAFRKYISPLGLLSRKVAAQFYPISVAKSGQSIFAKAWAVVGRNYVMADFNMLSDNELVAMVLRYVKENGLSKEALPIVFIGHSKTSYYSDRLHRVF